MKYPWWRYLVSGVSPLVGGLLAARAFADESPSRGVLGGICIGFTLGFIIGDGVGAKRVIAAIRRGFRV